MRDQPMSPLQPRNYSRPVRSAIELVERLLVEGIRHGHFDYSVTCETGAQGRRQLIVKAGKSHLISIPASDIPR